MHILRYRTAWHAQFLRLPIVSSLVTGDDGITLLGVCLRVCVVLSDWLLWVQVVTTAVLHLHVPGWCFGGCIILVLARFAFVECWLFWCSVGL
jgi:hypothetical protein